MPKVSISLEFRILSESAVLHLYYTGEEYRYAKDASEQGEAFHQLCEGKEYEYKFSHSCLRFADNPLVFPSPDEDESRGRLKTGNYVGTLSLPILCNDEKKSSLSFEICSIKTDYRSDYRTMLNDITQDYAELVMASNSPVSQRFEPNYSDNTKVLYQKFAFVKSVIESSEFAESIQKILYNPIRKWSDTEAEFPITSIRRIGRKTVRQLMNAADRMPLPGDIHIDGGLDTVPRKLTVPHKCDTVDCPENRFIKYVLKDFYQFCSSFQDFKNVEKGSRLYQESRNCCSRLEEILNQRLFREVNYPRFISLNNPVLQRREGYREILQAWTLYELAAKLSWTGGDNVYSAGKKNVAVLYEYWLFFKLARLISDIFDLKFDASELLTTDENSINLNLRQGRMVVMKGECRTLTRTLYVRFYYNRTFVHNGNYRTSGSWSAAMRPDYTLSVWTGSPNEADAEKENTIVHIHFDAKYRVRELLLLEKQKRDNADCYSLPDEDGADFLALEKEEQSVGIYKRGDLLKMHAYNDAIRRTGGSYVLYPGDKNQRLCGFHEIIPGLGAFAINPGSSEKDMSELKQFLTELLQHFQNRVSQREHRAYEDYRIYNSKRNIVKEDIPEPYGSDRALIPAETNVLIGYFHGEEHLEWIREHKLYNVRTGGRNGAIRMNVRIMTAKYLLLHGPENEFHIYRLSERGPRVFTKQELLKLKNLSSVYVPSGEYYLVFDLESSEEVTNLHLSWDFQKLCAAGIIGKGNRSAAPVGVSLEELLLALAE